MDLRSHDIGYNVSKSCLAKAWRAVEERMLQGFTPSFCGLKRDGKLFDDLPLPNVFVESRRAEALVHALFFIRNRLGRDYPLSSLFMPP